MPPGSGAVAHANGGWIHWLYADERGVLSHNIPVDGRPDPPFAIPERTKFSMRLLNMSASAYDLARLQMPNEDWLDWTLHVSTTKRGSGRRVYAKAHGRATKRLLGS